MDARNGTKSCFFIAPIKKRNSKERKRTEDILYNVLKATLPEMLWGFASEQIVLAAEDCDPDMFQSMQYHINNDDLCIIDLTGTAPNVMWEFGCRHKTGKPYILIAQEGTKLPFDIFHQRAIYYRWDNLDEEERTRARLELSSRIVEVINNFFLNGFSTYEMVRSSMLEVISEKLDEIIACVKIDVPEGGKADESINEHEVIQSNTRKESIEMDKESCEH